MKTLQEIFDIAVIGLRSQSFARSLNETGDCAYRDPYGCRCAIGWCIPDDKYDPDIENRSVLSKEVLALLEVDTESEKTWDVTCKLKDLQEAHDFGTTPKIMQRLLTSFAKKYKLTYND